MSERLTPITKEERIAKYKANQRHNNYMRMATVTGTLRGSEKYESELAELIMTTPDEDGLSVLDRMAIETDPKKRTLLKSYPREP